MPLILQRMINSLIFALSESFPGCYSSVLEAMTALLPEAEAVGKDQN